MIAIRDDHSARPPPMRCVNECAALLAILNNPLDGRRFRADDRNQTVGVDHIAKADIDELHSLSPPAFLLFLP